MGKEGGRAAAMDEEHAPAGRLEPQAEAAQLGVIVGGALSAGLQRVDRSLGEFQLHVRHPFGTRMRTRQDRNKEPYG